MTKEPVHETALQVFDGEILDGEILDGEILDPNNLDIGLFPHADDGDTSGGDEPVAIENDSDVPRHAAIAGLHQQCADYDNVGGRRRRTPEEIMRFEHLFLGKERSRAINFTTFILALKQKIESAHAQKRGVCPLAYVGFASCKMKRAQQHGSQPRPLEDLVLAILKKEFKDRGFQVTMHTIYHPVSPLECQFPEELFARICARTSITSYWKDRYRFRVSLELYWQNSQDISHQSQLWSDYEKELIPQLANEPMDEAMEQELEALGRNMVAETRQTMDHVEAQWIEPVEDPIFSELRQVFLREVARYRDHLDRIG
ncbi:hypothetical protein M011DRAFT_473986 [Sporormia fimetaria CBS 119925]|uniref:Uncharacterized protein n=1 Tax=Sporormia fimetaria CBS 119925 TaxID=1340428 RepID=A0A6A6VP44_9PLEO|nr:hypothetical protein M011DRAFT_473986 [Sporormia fimetaria CBS 119925]